MAIFVDLGVRREKVAREMRSNSTVLVSQWYLLTALSSHLADLEIVIIKRSLNQVADAGPAAYPVYSTAFQGCCAAIQVWTGVKSS